MELYKNIQKKEIREAISLRVLREVAGATNFEKGNNGRSKVYIYATGVKGYVAYVSAYNRELKIFDSCPAAIAQQIKEIVAQESNGPVEIEGVAPLTLENIPAVTPVYEIEKAAAVMAANEQPIVAQTADAINALNEVALVATPEDKELIAYEIREAKYYLNLLGAYGYSRKDQANFTAQLEKRVARLNTGYGVLAQKYQKELAQKQAEEAGVIFIASNTTPTPTAKKEEVAKTRATRSDVFKAAHALAKQQRAEGATGTYRALLSAALKATYKVVILI